MYRGPDREQRLVEGAKKEGQVTVYSSMIADQALRLLVVVLHPDRPVWPARLQKQVTAPNQRVLFTYNSTTHLLTIQAGHANDNNVEWDGLGFDSGNPHGALD